MRRVVGLLQPLGRHVRINLRRDEMRVAEQFLHAPQIRARVQQVRGVTVPELVRRQARIKPGDDQTPAYVAIKTKLQKMRSASPNVSNFYIMQIQGDKVVFIVDDAEDQPALVGEVYEKPEARVFSANQSTQVSENLYTDEFGTFLSGYAPIQGTSGSSALIIGADILADTVVQRENFIGNTIYFVMGFAILIAGVIIGLFSLTIIRDIKKLNRVAEKISMGDTDVAVDVHRRDEIGDLASSFGRMVASLKIMMSADSQPEPTKPESKGN